MATYYWVGGNGTWDNTSTTNWSTSSGGSGGSGPPTNADTVIFNTASASGTYTVTVAATAVSLSTTVANPTGGTVTISLSGSPTLCTAAGTLTLTSGTIGLNNNNLTTGIFSSNNSNTRSIAFGSGNIVLSSTTAAATVLQMGNATNFSWTGSGGFSRNQAATAMIQFGSTSGGSASNSINFSVTTGSSALTITNGSWFNNLNFTGSGCQVSGNVSIAGNLTLSSNGVAVYTTFSPTFVGTCTVTCNGRALGGTRIISVGTVTLADAFSCGTSQLNVINGTFNTTASNYSVTAGQITVEGGTLTLNGSTVTLSLAAPFAYTSGTVNAGTSTINCSNATPTFAGGGSTYYNVGFTSTSQTSGSITGANTFNNLSVTGRTAAGINAVSISANQTINGTLTLSAGTNATMRTFLQSNTLGTTRTLTCAAFSGTDADFRDITIAGAAAPVSGTRLGDCKGNSGITFGAGVSKYWNAAGNNWSAVGWATGSGGTPAANNFPLAQDTAVFESGSPASGSTVTINANYNIGTIDMSARTANTMTLATGTTTPAIYGNWINGTGTTLTGTGALTFAGRGSQTITSAGKTFTQPITINSPGGSVTLQDAFTSSINLACQLTSGTFDANGYNFTLTSSGSSFNSNVSTVRTLAIGGGTWTIAGSGTSWNCTTATNLTVTGTGTISLTSASAKTFAGGGLAYTNITLNQGGAGALTITGSNTFKDITNTYSATGATTIKFTSGTTTTLSQFTATGASGKVLTIGASTTSQATLTKPSTWYMGANSTNGGNNTGLTFTAGGGIDYLSVSYINGQVVAGASQLYYGSTNITNLKFGSATVSAVYYGSTKVF